MNLEEMKKLLDARSEEMLKKLHDDRMVFSGTRMTPLTWSEIRFISTTVKNWHKIMAVIQAAERLLNDEDGDLDAFSYGIIKNLRTSLEDLEKE